MMARVSAEKRAELEGFWRSHHDGWKSSPLNQREYCELHGLPLSRFGNWRDQFKVEDEVRQAGVLYRRGGLRHMSSHMSNREIEPVSTGYVPSAKSLPDGRRNFRLSDKKRIVAEALAPGASISAVARRYGIDKPLLFRWKRELAAPAPDPVFLPVTVSDAPEPADASSPAPLISMPQPVAAPVIVERSPQEIEVELKGGRRMRFARDTDPGTVRAMVEMLEGAGA
jgi:transposase-like protein